MPFWRSGRYWITDNGVEIFYDQNVGINTDSGDTLDANLIVKREAAQTDNMQEWRDETNAVIGRVLENAQIDVPGYAENVKSLAAAPGGTTYNATDDQSVFLVEIVDGDLTLVLPDPATLPIGRKYKAKITNLETAGFVRKLEIKSNGGANVENVSSFWLGQLGEAVTLHSDGTDWWVWPLNDGLPGVTRTVNLSETLRFSDGLILVSTAGGDVTLTMPALDERKTITIKKITNDINKVIVTAGGVTKIDDVTTFNITAFNESLSLRATDTQWWII